MKKTNAALAATLACAAIGLCGSPAMAQQSASSAPATAVRPADARHTAASAPRSAPVYDVEIVVFRATRTIGSPEDWAAEAGGAHGASTDADPGAPGEPAQPAAPAEPPAQAGSEPPASVVRLLPSSDFQLDTVAARLRASGRYVPVAHLAWAQTASPWGRPVEIPIRGVGLEAPDITGTVALERGQFLHLALHLRYAMSDPPAGLNAPPGTVFVLDQSHRVRLSTREYFDHPAFGVIALVTSAK